MSSCCNVTVRSIRNQGNECYRRATQVEAGSSPVKARNLYEQALSQYYQAKEKAEDRKDDFSAAKNIGKAAWRRGRYVLQVAGCRLQVEKSTFKSE